MPVAPNTRLGRYEIRSLLGAGGMGEVYLAYDTELERIVALKLLNEDLAADQQRMQRFIQEAKAVSALNHPNILTIHEIGTQDSVRFIATEFIDGVTLRHRMTNVRMKIGEILDIAAQVATALAAAHTAGIVHRDIKPENIMFRRDGYIKVLDFGLAKLTMPASSRHVSDAEASTLIETDPGVVMGTPLYMSPEQVRGLPADARTDVFSLGVVLYEMVVGSRPFDGATNSDVIVSILEKTPARLRRFAPEAPAELERIVTKALAKDTDERYQTIKDMAIDLRRLNRNLDVEAELLHSAETYESDEAPSERSRDRRSTGVETVIQAPTRVSETGTIHTTSSVEYVVNEIKRHRGGAIIAGAVLVMLLGGAGYFLYRFVNLPGAAGGAFQTTKVTRLTSTGKAFAAAISPDGKYVVHVEEGNNQQSLWVRQVATGSSVQIIPPADVFYWGLTFSNDSNYVYYVKNERGSGPFNKLYQVPSLGGVSKQLMAHVDSAVTFSPDGKRLAFVRDQLKKEETEIILSNADGSGEQMLARRKAPARFASDLSTRIAWSPDGNTIACAAGNIDAEGSYNNVVGVSVTDGSETPLTARRWQAINQVTWRSDGTGLAIVARDDASASTQLWHISYPDGEARRITNDLNAYRDVTMTANSSALVTVQMNRVSNIWVATQEDPNRARQITSGTIDGTGGLAWTPDGKLVYLSRASGKQDIWIMDAEGNNKKQLTHEGQNSRPTVSHDGRSIIFSSSGAGKNNVWRMDVDGGNPRQLTDGRSNANAFPSPDGRWLVYVSQDRGNGALWKLPIEGGQLVQLSEPTANLPIVSPDGKWVASFYWDEQADPPRGVMILPFDGGPATKRFDIKTSDGFALQWINDGTGILHFRNSNIWSQPVSGGEPIRLTDFQGDQVFNFSYSPDGKWLALARGTVTNDVVLIEDPK